jgi:serine/threonine-protein kinase RIO1
MAKRRGKKDPREYLTLLEEAIKEIKQAIRAADRNKIEILEGDIKKLKSYLKSKEVQIPRETLAEIKKLGID